MQGREDPVLPRGVGRRTEGQALNPREVFGLFPLGGAAKAAQNHIVIGVVPWISNRHVPEETAVCPQDVIRPEPEYLPLPYHAPRPPFPAPFALARKELCGHVLESLFRQRRRDFRSPPFVFCFRQCRIEVPGQHQCGALGPLLERGDNTLYC